MKDLQKTIVKLKEFLVLDAELREELKTIIKDTYDHLCYWVEGYDFKDDGETIECLYSYRYREENGTNWCKIPIKWLEDGYDYKAYCELMKKRTEEERKRMEEGGAE